MTDQNSDTIDDHVVEAYGRNLRTEPQEMRSIFVPTVISDLNFTEKGDSWSDFSLGAREMREVKERYGDTPNFVGKRKKRTGYFGVFHDSEMFDTVDDANVLLDPKSKTSLNMRYALQRRRDKTIHTGLFAPVREGENGGTVKAFPQSQIIQANERKYYKGRADSVAAPVDAPTGLTMAKLRAAKVLLDKSEIVGRRTFSAPSEQLAHLLTSEETTSADYAAVKALVNGEINSYLGFDFERYEASEVDTATTQVCGAWIQTAVQYKARPLTEFFVKPRYDKQGAVQSYHKYRDSALRLEDGGVVKVECARIQ
ncbi:MAG: phage capsid protein [Pseudomonadota bacterium]